MDDVENLSEEDIRDDLEDAKINSTGELEALVFRYNCKAKLGVDFLLNPAVLPACQSLSKFSLKVGEQQKKVLTRTLLNEELKLDGIKNDMGLSAELVMLNFVLFLFCFALCFVFV